MKLLAIDTSTDYLSIAVTDDDRLAASFHRKSSMRHSSLLIPTIEGLLKKARIGLKAIDCFSISIGPGSFTGLRIGVTTVKGLAYSMAKPIVAVPTLDIIARGAASHTGTICPVLDARKNKVYACIYKSDGNVIKKISKYLLLPARELAKKVAKYDKVLFLGDAIHLIDQTLLRKVWHPRARVCARMGLEYFMSGTLTAPEDLEPLYLYSRECDITGV